jgi:multicomponent Na+:H+ antiporter subunit G
MHVATKPATLGLLLVLTGVLLRADGLAPVTKLGLAIVLQFLTAPVAAHLVGRATYHAGGADDLELEVDELAPLEARRRMEDPDPD